MRRNPGTLLSIAVLSGLMAFSATARAGDDAPAPQIPGTQPLAKIEAPALKALLGSWDLTVKSDKGVQKGTATWSLIVADTTALEELHMGEGAEAFHGLGCFRVGTDGKSLRLWWFDSTGPGGVWPFTGSLVEGGYDLEGDMKGQKMLLTMRTVGAGHEFTMKQGDKVMTTVTYAKAAKPAVAAPAVVKQPLLQAVIGDWTSAGAMLGQTFTGTLSFRAGLAGGHVLQDYVVKTPSGERFGFGVWTMGTDGKKLSTWMFLSMLPDPVMLEGPVTDSTWEGTGKTSMGEVKKKLVKTATGFEMTTWFGGAEAGKETYTKK